MRKFAATLASAALLMAGTTGAFADSTAKNAPVVAIPGSTAPAAVSTNGTGLPVGTKSADLQRISIAGWVGIVIVIGGVVYLLSNNGGGHHHTTTTGKPA